MTSCPAKEQRHCKEGGGREYQRDISLGSVHAKPSASESPSTTQEGLQQQGKLKISYGSSLLSI